MTIDEKIDIFLEQLEVALIAFKEALREVLRLSVIAVASIFVKVLLDRFASISDTNLVAAVMFVILRALDRWLWKYRKEWQGEARGLIPF